MARHEAPPTGAMAAAEAEDTAAELSAATANATQVGGMSEAPTQVSRAQSEALQRQAPLAGATVVSPPAATSTPRGMLAALGLFASAALVLLALQIGAPKPWQETDPPTARTDAKSSAPVAPWGEHERSGEHEPKEAPSEARTTEAPSEVRTTEAPPVPVTASESPEATTTTTEAEPAETSSGAPTDADDATKGVETSTGTSTQPNETKQAGQASEKPSNSTAKRPTKRPVEERIDDGCLKVRFGNAETGVKVLREAREDRPRDAELLRCLAQGLQTIGDYTEAENYYKQLLANTHPRNLPALLGLAQVNELLGRRDRAANYYQMVLMIDPDNKSARAFLGSKAGAAPSAAGFEL